MLTQFRFQNFKSWRDTGVMRFAPLTGFFGTNSSGKTAILQFLLMLKQTVETSDRGRVLHFGNNRTYIDLGTSYDIIHKHILPGTLSFSFQWQLDQNQELVDLPTAEYPIKAIGNKLAKQSDFKFKSEIELDGNHFLVQRLVYSYADTNQQWPEIGIYFDPSLADAQKSYSLFVKGILEEQLKDPDQAIVAPVKFYGLPSQDKIRFGHNQLFPKLTANLEQLFESIYYLGPLREYPQRSYLWSGEKPDGVRARGEDAIPALLASGEEVREKIAYWLKELGLVHEFWLQPIAENRRAYEVLIRRFPNSPEVFLTDLGFGISQILPVLVLCYYVPEGSIIVLEHPEIHLHPSVQAGLVDVLIDVIKNRHVQIILESHSEHLLRRLQRRIAEETQHFSNQDAALYFCSVDDQGASQLTSLNVDPFGNITNWPKDFFGDHMGDLVAMTEASIQRQEAQSEIAPA